MGIFVMVLMALSAVPQPRTPAGVVVVANTADSTVSLIAGDTHRVLATLPAGQGPHEVAVSRDGRLAFVANSGPTTHPGHTVTVIDVAARAVQRTINLPECHPHDVAVSRDSTLLWVTCHPVRRGILEVNLETNSNTFFPTGEDGGWMFRPSADEKSLFVANLEGGSVSLIDRASRAVRTVRLADGQMIVEPAADGTEVWTSNLKNGKVAILDPRTARIVGTIPEPIVGAGRVRFLPNQRAVLVVGEKEIAVIDRRTRKIARTVPLAAGAKCITLSHDGRLAWVTNPENQSVTLLDLTTGDVVDKVIVGHEPDGIAWAQGQQR